MVQTMRIQGCGLIVWRRRERRRWTSISTESWRKGLGDGLSFKFVLAGLAVPWSWMCSRGYLSAQPSLSLSLLSLWRDRSFSSAFVSLSSVILARETLCPWWRRQPCGSVDRQHTSHATKNFNWGCSCHMIQTRQRNIETCIVLTCVGAWLLGLLNVLRT